MPRKRTSIADADHSGPIRPGVAGLRPSRGKLSIEIDTSNAAFEPDPKQEVARVLNGLAAALLGGAADYTLRGRLVDVNGNQIGSWFWEVQ